MGLWVSNFWATDFWVADFWTGDVEANISGKINFAESEIVAGGNQTVITLVGATWAAAGATFDAQRQNIIDGFDSAQSEATGWNAEVRDKEVVGAVVRTSDTVVTITWTAAPAYNVTATETITVTVPASAISGSQALTGSPTILVSLVPANASISGAIMAAMNKPTVPQALALKFSKQANETLQDAERRWLDAQAGVNTASVQGMWIQYLGGKGYAGTVGDMQLAWWRDGAPE